MESSAPSSNIPNEIIRIILLQLPVKSIIRFPMRMQKWPLGEAADYPLIRGSNQYHVTALCSCNGFVLLAAAERDILLWNPLTRCLTKVLESPYPGIKNSGVLAGLCYNSRTRDYKVVLLLRHLMDYDNPWGYSSGANKNRIIYFDPMRDEFRILPTPSERRENNSIVGLGVIDDCLSMACIPHHNEAKTNTLQVLIMKEYGIEESWMTAFDIQMPQLSYGNHGLTFYSQPNNTEQVLFMRRGSNRHHVYVYDRKDERKEVLMDFLKQSTGLDDENFASMFFYVENFDCLALQPHDYIFS
ncbi:PREDICTED: uncharacterized protein LOC109186714 [Ipomoea nil]|uniref:uncharacterized protein LOC109186714 n=1 Tax=Ipomoea nil TaxID=35883 RepID=UPI000901C655|nr:PREDICTED: uncharacterized protein LOC109186714 [Ipomoea nil]